MRARLPASTFALAVKEELCALPFSRREGQAELHGVIRAAGSLILGPGGIACEVRCGRPVVARRVYRLLRDVAGARPLLLVRRSAGKTDGRFVCRAVATPPSAVHRPAVSEGPPLRPGAPRGSSPSPTAMLKALGLLDRAGRRREGIPVALRSGHLAPALLRGYFLGAGSVDDPVRDHHLELDVDPDSQDVATDLLAALAELGLRGGSSRRRGRIVVYLKDGAAIVTLLAAMGAGTALMAYEEQRIRKQVRSDVNRLVNAETANIGKSAVAGVQQARAVAALQAAGILETLAPELQAVALVRLHHPEASLRELGQLLQPPLGKSGVQHRLRRIVGLEARRPGRRAETQRGPGASVGK